MTASNFWDCLTKPGEVGFRLSTTCWLTLRPQGGEVQIITIRIVEDGSTIPIVLPISPGVLLSTPALLTRRVAIDVHAPTDATSAANVLEQKG